MTIKELLKEIDNHNNGGEDIYNTALHSLGDKDSEIISVKVFLQELLSVCKD